jgi:hypothetical protein
MALRGVRACRFANHFLPIRSFSNAGPPFDDLLQGNPRKKISAANQRRSASARREKNFCAQRAQQRRAHFAMLENPCFMQVSVMSQSLQCLRQDFAKRTNVHDELRCLRSSNTARAR